MSKAEIKSYLLGPIGTNCYFVINKDTKEVIVIDPADRPDYLASEIRRMELKPVAILLTHGHFDHISGVNELRKEFGIEVYAHELEQDVLQSVELNSSIMMGRSHAYATYADVLLGDGQQLDMAGFHIIVLHTPGHTRGGCSYYFPDEGAVFSGDTLFNESIGRTDFPTGSMSDLVRGVKEKLFTLPDDTIVYPGHMSATTIGHEKKYNPFF